MPERRRVVMKIERTDLPQNERYVLAISVLPDSPRED